MSIAEKGGQIGCFYCNFTGRLVEEQCPVCSGTGDANAKGKLCWKCQGAGVIDMPNVEKYADMMERRVELAILHGEKAYNDTEGNLDYALRVTIQYYTEAIIEHLDEITPIKTE